MDPPQTPQTPQRQGPTESSIAETPGGTPAETQRPSQTPPPQQQRGPPPIIRGRRSPNPLVRVREDAQLGEESIEVLWNQLRRLRAQENELLRRIQAAEGMNGSRRPTSPLQTVTNRPSLVSSPSARTPSPTQEKIFQPIRF